jgi:hypothetical protein
MTADKEKPGGAATQPGGGGLAAGDGPSDQDHYRASARDCQAAARAAIAGLLAGESANGTDPAELGPWSECFQALAAAPDLPTRQRIFDALTRDDPGLARLIAGDPQPARPLPQVIVTNRPMSDVTQDALDALAAANDPPSLFVRSGGLARVRADERGRPVIDDVDAGILRAMMERSALWYRVTKEREFRHVPPPDDNVRDALALGAWPFPPLESITETPALRPDGTILDRPGYDPATRLYYVPARGFTAPAIPAAPSRSEVAAAVALVEEAIGEFPYADAASKANAWALLLTPILRPAIEGNTPLALIDKPQAGTGASLLAEAVSILATGRQAAMMSAPADDTEWRKKITATLLEGATMVTIDNVEDTLQSASLALALTSSAWKDRVLGQSATVVLSQRATWLATGNNLKLGGDMPRRCYWIRLDAQTAQPWRRRDFKHPGLIGWVTEHRGQLLGALLTIARAWYAGGRPRADVQELGSFESWSRIMAGVLTHAGISGFLGNLEELYARVDEEGEQWRRFLETWHEVLGQTPVTVADLLRLMRPPEEKGAKAEPEQAGLLPEDQAQQAKDEERGRALLEALPDYLADGLADARSAGGFSRRLGKALAKRCDMVFDDSGLRLTKLPSEGKQTAKWLVRKGKK